MNYEQDVKEIREDFIKSHFPESYQKMTEDNTLFEYLTKIESEYYERVEEIYDELFSQYLRNKKESIFLKKVERLSKEVELKILAKDKAAEEILFKETL